MNPVAPVTRTRTLNDIANSRARTAASILKCVDAAYSSDWRRGRQLHTKVTEGDREELMRSAKVFRAILGLSMGVTLCASLAQAQPEDKRTYFTFSAPIALPGQTLPAGRY